MEEGKHEKKSKSKGTSTESNKASIEDDLTNSDSDSVWKTPSKLKEEVQTIIDIMGPSLSPKFRYNTSSDADNEESVFSNSRFSSIRFKEQCDCNVYSEGTNEKPDLPDIPSKDETNISTAADVNTSTLSTIDEFSEAKINTANYTLEQNDPNVQYICPPPLLPTNMYSECVCPQVASILQGRGILPVPAKIPSNIEDSAATRNGESNGPNDKICPKLTSTNKESKNAVIDWLKTIVSSSQRPGGGKDCSCDYYKMNIKRRRGDNNSPPRRVVFELVHDIPKSNLKNGLANYASQNTCCLKESKNMENERKAEQQVQTDLQNEGCKNFKETCAHECATAFKKPMEKTTYCDTSGKTRVDVYYFDHGSFNHYRTTDAPPLVTTDNVADKTEKHTTRFWAEIFGTFHIGISFFTSFVLQLLRFILYSIIRPLTIGIIQLASDYFFKPLLATCFNGVIQPILILCYNIAASIRDLLDPIAEGMGYFYRELAVLIRAFRLVEVVNESCHTTCNGEKRSKKCKTIC